MSGRRFTALGTAILVAALAQQIEASPTPAQKCASSKAIAVGKKISGKAKCDSKAAKTGDLSGRAVCLQKVSDKFGVKWGKIELKGGCATTGDESTLEAKVDAHLGDLESELVVAGPASVCTGTKFKEAGKKGFCRLKCHAKAQKTGATVDSLCLAKCTAKFSQKCGLAEGSSPCHAATGDCPKVEATVDAFVDEAVRELPTTVQPACRLDPSRTIFAGGQSSNACHAFDGNQALCEQAFHGTRNIGQFASCWYDGGDCNGCGQGNRRAGLCVNTCEEGAAQPICAGDPSRTVFAGFTDTAACKQFNGDQATCEQAFHLDSGGIAATCWYDTGSSECSGCGPNNQSSGACTNTCPVCPIDPGRTAFVGGPSSSACRTLDGDPTGCATAFHIGRYGNPVGDARVSSCWYNSTNNRCFGCGPNNASDGDCRNDCQPSPFCADLTRTQFVGGPRAGGCGQFGGDQAGCESAWHVSRDGLAASCFYSGGQCNGCGYSNEDGGDCTNTCRGPSCGDNVVNQPSEECDGTDAAACVSIGLGCRGDCRCERCGNSSIDSGEVCDPPSQPGGCGAGESCNSTCTDCQTVCGDGIIGPGETCDAPGQPSTCPAGQTCNGTCTGCQTVCGDGVIGGGETCDPPGQQGTCASGQLCGSSCTSCLTCLDSTRTTFRGGPFTGACLGLAQAACESSWHETLSGAAASCAFNGSCFGCGPGNEGPSCVNTCSCPATTIPAGGGTFNGSTVGGTIMLSGSCQPLSAASPERMFAWTPSTSGVANINTCGGITNYDTVVYIKSGSCSGAEAGCNDDFCGGSGLLSTITPTVTAGQRYIIVVDGYAGLQGNFTLSVTPPP